MRIATVNVNGLRAALRKGLPAWLESRGADVVCMQEVRAPDEVVEAAFDEGWHVVHSCCEIKGRAGVALLSRSPLADVLVDAAALGPVAAEPAHTGRWVEGTVDSPAGPVRVVSVYVHSGQAEDAVKMGQKYAHLDLMTERLGVLSRSFERVLVMGDINIAHTNDDIKNWRGNLKTAGFLPEERAYLDRWLASGWVDVHRSLVGQRPGPYTWWSVRGQAFDNDSGWRIDYHLATPALAAAATAAEVDRAASWDARWSDHAPLVVDYAL